MDDPMWVNQQDPISMDSVGTQKEVWNTCRDGWMIGADEERERESGKTMMSARLDHDDDDRVKAFHDVIVQ